MVDLFDKGIPHIDAYIYIMFLFKIPLVVSSPLERFMKLLGMAINMFLEGGNLCLMDPEFYRAVCFVLGPVVQSVLDFCRIFCIGKDLVP